MAYIVDGDTFTNRALLSVDKDYVGSNLTDFVAPYDLSVLTTADFWDIVKSDGGDIRATLADGTTRIALELENFSVGSELGQIYSLISSVSSSVDTDFYIYWGNAGLSQPAEDAAYGKEAVWPSNIRTAYHFSQDPSGTPPQSIDSTAQDKDGTTNNMEGADLINSATYGKAWQTDGLDEYVALDAGEVSNSAGSFEILLRTNFAYDDAGLGQSIVAMYDSNPDRNVFYYDKNTDQFGFNVNSNTLWSPTQSFASGTVIHMVITWDSGETTKRRMYLDGVEVANTTVLGTFTVPTNYWLSVQMYNSVLEAYGQYEFMEFRHYNEEVSVDWVNASMEALVNPDTFYTAAAYESSNGLTGLGMINVT